MPFFREGLLISTKYQSKGKGQTGKQWHSEKNLNVLLSVIIEPKISKNFIKKQIKSWRQAVKLLLNLYS